MNSIMTAPEKRRPGRQPGSRDSQPRSMKTRKFKQLDLSTAIKAARNAGLENFRIDIDSKGTISVVPTKPVEPVEPAGGNEWDEVLKE
jgi:hypothetical protein